MHVNSSHNNTAEGYLSRLSLWRAGSWQSGKCGESGPKTHHKISTKAEGVTLCNWASWSDSTPPVLVSAIENINSPLSSILAASVAVTNTSILSSMAGGAMIAIIVATLINHSQLSGDNGPTLSRWRDGGFNPNIARESNSVKRGRHKRLLTESDCDAGI